MLADEVATLTEITGTRLVPYGSLVLAAWPGDHGQVRELVAASLDDALRRGEGSGVSIMRWAEALVCNGLGRYSEAFVAAQQSAELRQPLDSAGVWGLVELVERPRGAGRPPP